MMDIYYGPRQSGKTYRLLECAHNNEAIFIVGWGLQLKHVVDHYNRIRVNFSKCGGIVGFMSARQFMSSFKDMQKGTKVCMDNVNDVIRMCFPKQEICGVSLTPFPSNLVNLKFDQSEAYFQSRKEFLSGIGTGRLK